jgi:hypothetical protein
MPTDVEDVNMLQRYFKGIMTRSEHHAKSINVVILVLIGAVVWRKDANTVLKIRAKDGELKNVLWVNISGTQYAFSYNHDTGQIDLRQNNTHGNTIRSFDNTTTAEEIKDFFETM